MYFENNNLMKNLVMYKYDSRKSMKMQDEVIELNYNEFTLDIINEKK